VRSPVPAGRPAGALTWLAGLLAVVAVVALPATRAGAAPGVSFSAVVNGQPAATSSDARPAQLFPSHEALVKVSVANHGTSTVSVSTVRFQGTVLDLPLFSYDTAVDLTVAPGAAKSLKFPVVLTGIGSQATGLVGASLTLLGTGGATLGTINLVTDIHGSVRSIYGLFGLAVLLLTISSLTLALISLARHTLSQNRWARGVRFLIPGFGVGLVLTFTLSVFKVFTPTAGHWLPLLIVPSIVGLALGFLTPAPNEEEYDDYDEDVLLAQIIVVDDDPLDDPGELVSAGPTAATGRQTMAPVRPSAAAAPPTGAPPSPPDPRTTAPPDGRPTGAPGQPDGRPTAGA
jgi:hypothetical protein